MSENIKFKKDHFTLPDGYFYMFDDDTDVVYQRTADGITSFSYPMDTLLDFEVKSLEHDGTNFWTLEQVVNDPTDPNEVVESIAIKRWGIENYVCVKKSQINLNAGGGHKYDSSAFTVEHYHTTISGSIITGADRLPVNEYWSKVSSGMSVTIGPNNEGVTETINVHDWEEGNIVLSDPITVDYPYDTDVSFYNNLWIFNNYDGEDSTSAALYKLNAYTGSYITRYTAAEYKDVTACSFYKITALKDYVTENVGTDMLCYVKATNLLFVDVDTPGLSLNNYGSMLLDNVTDDSNSIIDVYDLAIEDDNIYKLQHKANYFGSTEGFSNASYHIGTQTSIVTSISLISDKSIISANGTATTSIFARVKDQFWQPIAGRLVYFDHNESSSGTIVSSPVNTDSDGEASTTFRAGTLAVEVKITATIDQV